MAGVIFAIGTMDTKSEELAYVAQCVRDAGAQVQMVDVSTLTSTEHSPDIDRFTVLGDRSLPSEGDRGSCLAVMGAALSDFLLAEHAHGRLAGVLGIGGSGGTSLITTAMRALPIGLPKMMVSTVASGNTAPYVDCSDITMMFSVVDVAGLNVVSKAILANAAHAMVGMVSHRVAAAEQRIALGLTMFGVTTPCVTRVRSALEAKHFDCLVFHATGTGGRAMEQLIDAGFLEGVLDITTTEVADRIVGGVFPAGEHRLEAALRRQVPLVLSLGACDMVNFGSRDTIPSRFAHRKFHIHNAQVTLMRTTVDENRQIGRWITDKLNRSVAPLTVVIPEHGVSALDAVGHPFYDPEADAALFDEIEASLEQTSDRRVVRLPLHINDPEFSIQLVNCFEDLWRFRGSDLAQF